MFLIVILILCVCQDEVAKFTQASRRHVASGTPPTMHEKVTQPTGVNENANVDDKSISKTQSEHHSAKLTTTIISDMTETMATVEQDISAATKRLESTLGKFKDDIAVITEQHGSATSVDVDGTNHQAQQEAMTSKLDAMMQKMNTQMKAMSDQQETMKALQAQLLSAATMKFRPALAARKPSSPVKQSFKMNPSGVKGPPIGLTEPS